MTFEVLQTEFTISALHFWTDQTAYYPSRLAAHILKYWYWGEHLSDSNTYMYIPFPSTRPVKDAFIACCDECDTECCSYGILENARVILCHVEIDTNHIVQTSHSLSLSSKMTSPASQTSVRPDVEYVGNDNAFLQPLLVTICFSGPLPQHLIRRYIVLFYPLFLLFCAYLYISGARQNYRLFI